MALKYIADKSALARLKYPTVAARLAPLVGRSGRERSLIGARRHPLRRLRQVASAQA
jgi:hypothetical protein